jgi:hypothetical protein
MMQLTIAATGSGKEPYSMSLPRAAKCAPT